MNKNRKTVTVRKTSYYLVYPGGLRKVPISYKGYAQFVTRLRYDMDLINSGFSVKAVTYDAEFPVCEHCRVRPVAVDVDCDGTYLLSVCDHPLCIRGRSIAYEGLSRESAETIREFFR